MTSYDSQNFSLASVRLAAVEAASEVIDPRTNRFDTKKLFPNATNVTHYIFYTKKDITEQEARLRVIERNKDFMV